MNGKRHMTSDILSAGIDVVTTVNIQHLESIADEVERMTPRRGSVNGYRTLRAKPARSSFDPSPEQLRRRMLHGNIYPQDRVPRFTLLPHRQPDRPPSSPCGS
jgi:two-component system sensor histidine kinase KdpD